MVGPFMQGMLLMGVIYWYSRGMLNMINDYYRAEFQKQLETKSADRKPVEVDEMEILLKKTDDGIQHGKTILERDILENLFCPVEHEPDVCFNETELRRFLELTLSICFSNNLSNTVLNKMENNSEGCQNSFMAFTDSVLKT